MSRPHQFSQLTEQFSDVKNLDFWGASQFCKSTILVGLKPLSVKTFRDPLTKMGCSRFLQQLEVGYGD